MTDRTDHVVSPLAVGILGAGPGVSALHLPTLGMLGELFTVVHISDGGSGRARQLAASVPNPRVSWSQGEHDLLDDPRVEVVLVASPPEHHARQVLAAVAAGKRVVFCEKPLATTPADIDAVIEACRASGTVLVVGTNHLYDPGWLRAAELLLASPAPDARVRSIAITLSLPPNGRYHDLVSEQPAPAVSGSNRRGRPDLTDPAVASAVLRQLLTGLAVHDLPAVRRLAPVFEHIVYARLLAPIGYAVGYRASGTLVQLTALMLPAGADALWRMTVTTADDRRIDVDFPAAFTHGGSARVRQRLSDGTLIEHPRTPDDGYLEEWRALAAAVRPHVASAAAEVAAGAGHSMHYDDLRADALYATALADAAAEALVASLVQAPWKATPSQATPSPTTASPTGVVQ